MLSKLWCIGFLLIMTLAFPAKANVEVELEHWWISPGESLAVKAIQNAVEKEGAKFTSIAVSTRDKLSRDVIKRLSFGYPPAISQWLSGEDIVRLHKMNAVVTLPNQWRGEPIEDVLLPHVYEWVKDKNTKGLTNLPIGIHIQNTAFINAHIYKELNLSPPKDWNDFLNQAEKIKKSGYIPLAISEDEWLLLKVFSSIIVSQIGADNYNKFFNPHEKITQWEKEVLNAIKIYKSLKPFTDIERSQRSWNEATNMLIEKKAAMQVIGDYAKGEFFAKGLKQGEDFLCNLAPGADKAMYMADTFMILKVESESLKKGQNLLFDISLSKEFQIDFSSKKGSIPIRKSIDPKRLDPCGAKFYKLFLEENKDDPVMEHESVNRSRLTLVQELIRNIWHNEEMSAEEATKYFLDEVNNSIN